MLVSGVVCSTLDPIEATLSFSEIVEGILDENSFEATEATINSVVATGEGYKLTLTPMDIGTVSIALKEGVIVDRAGNSNLRSEETLAITSRPDEELSALTRLYPNPTKGVFTLEFGWASAGEKQIEVYNALGQLVHQVSTQAYAAVIDLHHQPTAQYYVKITSAQQVAMKKLVIE